MDSTIAQWIQVGSVAFLTAIVSAYLAVRRSANESKRLDRGDTFNEMKTLIETARQDAALARSYYDSQRGILSKRIDDLSREHMECLAKAAKFEAMVADLQNEVAELKQRMTDRREDHTTKKGRE